MSKVNQRLDVLAPEMLATLCRGVEKESLRIRPDGTLARTPHPTALGAALTNAYITTDFSESQLELITGVHASAEACAAELTEIHQFVFRHIGDEALWSCSMPGNLPADDEIPIGRYGSSNIGRLKSVYRTGLSQRYGRRMQTISGVHYNWSLPDAAWNVLRGGGQGRQDELAFRNDAYFALIRNFRRHSWLPIFLFGASPAACATFVAGREHRLEPLSPDTLYMPHATSLRMGKLGYQSDAQSSLAVSYNCLDSYASSLRHALTETYPPYESIGVRDGDNYKQLASTLLQIENEFYGTVRPKRRVRRGERPLHALMERGVEYVEVRCMDVDPFSAIGIAPSTMHFLDTFLLHCLLRESPGDHAAELAENSSNQQCAAERGREPGLMLRRGGASVSLRDWGMQILQDCAPIAEAQDRASGRRLHRDALAAAEHALASPASTPSARVLDEMRQRFHDSFFQFGLAQSLLHRAELSNLALSRDAELRWVGLAGESQQAQQRMEAEDTLPFETFRQEYLARDMSSAPLSGPTR